LDGVIEPVESDASSLAYCSFCKNQLKISQCVLFCAHYSCRRTTCTYQRTPAFESSSPEQREPGLTEKLAPVIEESHLPLQEPLDCQALYESSQNLFAHMQTYRPAIEIGRPIHQQEKISNSS